MIYRLSRCSAGKGKWFWVVVEPRPSKHGGIEYWSDDWRVNVIASGTAANSAEAERQAEAATPGVVAWHGNLLAICERKRRISEQRKARRSAKRSPETPEFVYSFSWGDDCSQKEPWEWKHRIVKKTKTRIYVEREWTPQGAGEDWDGTIPETFVLDRATFERAGEAYSRSQREFYYVSPEHYWKERRRNTYTPPNKASAAWSYVPSCLSFFELDLSATAEQLQSAYRRKALRTHPDHGGNDAEFKIVEARYQEARRVLA